MTTMMKTCRLLLVVVATAIVCTSAVIGTSAPASAPADPVYPCPWRTVPHADEDPFIQKLGRWAVEQQPFMHYDKVESAKLQGVGSCTTMTHNYYYELIIDANIRGPKDKYMAVVYVVNFTQPQKLMSFSAIVPPHRPPAAN